MLSAQDLMAGTGVGAGSGNGAGMRALLSWEYNEVVLDAWMRPWADELASIVEAVFVSHGASPANRARARAVHRAVLRAVGAASSARVVVPLVVYNPLERTAPFAPFVTG